MTKPSREELRAMADELDMYAENAALMAFALHWYAAGQADQREKDAGICDDLKNGDDKEYDDGVNVCIDAIRSQSND